MIVCLFFTGEGENIQVMFAQLQPPPQQHVIEQENEEEDDIEDIEVEFVENDLFESDLFSEDSDNDLFVW